MAELQDYIGQSCIFLYLRKYNEQLFLDELGNEDHLVVMSARLMSFVRLVHGRSQDIVLSYHEVYVSIETMHRRTSKCSLTSKCVAYFGRQMIGAARFAVNSLQRIHSFMILLLLNPVILVSPSDWIHIARESLTEI